MTQLDHLLPEVLQEPHVLEHGPMGYLRLLDKLGFAPIERGIWAVVGRTSRTQGWKLHVSSIPIEAIQLVLLIAPCLKKLGVSFKVAKDETILSQLNEGELGGTQIGKFITIYPESDAQARELALQLGEITAEFNGPIITTDLRLSRVVYARYGNFNPIIYRDRLGQIILCVYMPDGTVVADTYSVPFVIPDGVDNPFLDLIYPDPKLREDHGVNSTVASVENEQRSSKLIGPGYLILDVEKQHAKGSVFRAIDLRSQEVVSAKLIKQGRKYCLSDIYGRDMRSRLRRQEYLHNVLSGHPAIPKADPYFEHEGDGYLPIQFIEGVSIESLAVRSLAGRSWRSLDVEQQLRQLSYLESLVIAVQELHARGYVHRDLTASNVWIGVDERVYLLDLELCHRADDPSPAFGLGTPGFMSPQQAARKPPAFADDIYAIGCVMTLVLSGIDPRRVLFSGQESRIEKIQDLTGADPTILNILDQCLLADPCARPQLEDIRSAIRAYIDNLADSHQHAAPTILTARGSKGLQTRVRQLIRAGLRGLLAEYIAEPNSGLWLSIAMRNPSHQTGAQSSGSYELRRSANRGVAGVVYLLGRLARFGYTTAAARRRVQTAVEWLLANEPAPDSGMPGLHFGDAGVAMALVEASAGGLFPMDARISDFVVAALNGILDWPDITHGDAGQGLAALYCGNLLGDATFLALSHRCADYLIANQEPDGSWRMPPGVDGMSGQTLTGFAHGVSGIVYFLTAYGHQFGRSTAKHAADLGAQWLISQAIPSQDATVLEWKYSDTNSDRWKWWCHGAPGIALAFLKLYEETKFPLYAETAAKALHAHPKDLRYGNLSQCHGMSGLGEIYLEAQRVLGDGEWSERSESISRVLIHTCRESRGNSAAWLVEDPFQPTADLMVGASGVIHFLLGFSLQDQRTGFPLLL